MNIISYNFSFLIKTIHVIIINKKKVILKNIQRAKTYSIAPNVSHENFIAQVFYTYVIRLTMFNWLNGG